MSDRETQSRCTNPGEGRGGGDHTYIPPLLQQFISRRRRRKKKRVRHDLKRSSISQLHFIHQAPRGVAHATHYQRLMGVLVRARGDAATATATAAAAAAAAVEEEEVSD